MREVATGTALYVWIVVVFFVLMAAGAVVWATVVYPAQLAGERNAQVQSRQNVVGTQTAMRQDMQDYARQTQCQPCQQQDIYDMERLRDQLPDPSYVPSDIEQFLAVHGG